MNIQQLRVQIEALQSATMDENKNFRSAYDEGKFDALSVVDALLDSLQEEPVSEDLEEAAHKFVMDNFGNPKEPLYKFDQRCFKEGAKWQAEQFEKERLKHCDELTPEQAQIESDFVTQHLKENNCTPTFIDAIKYGMRLQKEQMMKDAIEAYIRRNKYTKKNVLNGLDVTCDAIQKFNGGDKVKIIITKEDWR